MARFVPNPAFDAQAKASPEMKQMLRSAAQEIASAARSNVHSIMPNKKVANQIVVVEGVTSVSVANLHHGSHLDEWGSINNPAYAPLRRAARSSGARFEEGA